MIAQEKALLAAREEYRKMEEYVMQTGSDAVPIHAVEGNLWKSALRMGLYLLQAFVAAQGDGDVGATFVLPEGRTVKRLEATHPRRYVSIFGELEIPRKVYGTREGQKLEGVPLDARLGLPESAFSYLLQDWCQTLCVQGSFAEASNTLGKILGPRQSVRCLEHMNQSMSEEVEGFREEQPAPPKEEEGELLVVMADHKGIPMRRAAGEPRPKDPKHLRKGEKKNRKRMAWGGASYTIQAFPRTVAEVMEEVLRQEAHARRPKPQHKRVRAELTREKEGREVKGKEVVFGWLRKEKEQRATEGKKQVVFLSDAEPSLEELAREELGEFVSIPDLMHVTPRLWEAAHCFHAEGSDVASAFVEKQLEKVLSGKTEYVIRGLRQSATKQGLRGNKAKTIAQVTQYCEKNEHRMRYDEYLAAGYPIGTGPVEGACRNVVKDRFEQTGMRWSLPGAQAMLQLRRTQQSPKRPISTTTGTLTATTVSTTKPNASIRTVKLSQTLAGTEKGSGKRVTPN